MQDRTTSESPQNLRRRSFLAGGAALLAGLIAQPAVASGLVPPKRPDFISGPVPPQRPPVDGGLVPPRRPDAGTITAHAPGRELWLHNVNTGEKFRGEFWKNGKFLPDALAELNRFLRDHHNGKVHQIEPELFDLLHQISQRLDTGRPYEIICGYRSPETNAMLARRSRAVAKNSLHMDGMAIDLRMQGASLKNLRKAAVSCKAGGVGYYPRSNFVHVDVGAVRTW